MRSTVKNTMSNTMRRTLIYTMMSSLSTIMEKTMKMDLPLVANLFGRQKIVEEEQELAGWQHKSAKTAIEQVPLCWLRGRKIKI